MISELRMRELESVAAQMMFLYDKLTVTHGMNQTTAYEWVGGYFRGGWK